MKIWRIRLHRPRTMKHPIQVTMELDLTISFSINICTPTTKLSSINSGVRIQHTLPLSNLVDQYASYQKRYHCMILYICHRQIQNLQGKRDPVWWGETFHRRLLHSILSIQTIVSRYHLLLSFLLSMEHSEKNSNQSWTISWSIATPTDIYQQP